MIRSGVIEIPAICSALRRADTEKGTAMAKGHKCPACGKYTLQPYTTNQLKCSDCKAVFKKDRVA
jgi:ribosomal protein L37AE/L43A